MQVLVSALVVPRDQHDELNHAHEGDEGAEVVAAAEVLDAGEVLVANADDAACGQGEGKNEVCDGGGHREAGLRV